MVVRVDAKAVVQRREVKDAQFVLRDGELGVIVAACSKRDGFAIDVGHDADGVAVFRHAQIRSAIAFFRMVKRVGQAEGMADFVQCRVPAVVFDGVPACDAVGDIVAEGIVGGEALGAQVYAAAIDAVANGLRGIHRVLVEVERGIVAFAEFDVDVLGDVIEHGTNGRFLCLAVSIKAAHRLARLVFIHGRGGKGVGDVQPLAGFVTDEVALAGEAAVDGLDEVRHVGIAIAGEGGVGVGAVVVRRRFVVIDDVRGNARLRRIQFRPLRRADFDAVFFVVFRQAVVGGVDFEGRRGLPRRDGQVFFDRLRREIGIRGFAVFEA